MKQNHVVAACGALLGLVGGVLILRGGAPEIMALFGGPALPQVAIGDPAWVGVAFMRAFGAAVLALGLVMVGLSRLDGEAAGVIAVPLAVGLGVLGLITGVQAQAIWSTSGAWALTVLLGIACLVAASWRPIKRDAVAR